MAQQDDGTTKIIIAGGIVAAAYFGIVKPILNAVGVSDEDINLIQKYRDLSPGENPFSIHYEPFQEYYGDQWNGIDQMRDYFVSLSEYEPVFGMYQGRLQSVDDALKIYNSFSFWHNVDVNTVISVFRSLQAKSDVSFIAAYLYFNYDIDLWQYLKHGSQILPFFNNGLTDSNIAQILYYIETLPDTQ